MDFSVDFHNKVAIVTGAGKGVGRAAALSLAHAGAAVVVNDLNPDRAAAIVDAIHERGGDALAWVADVSNRFQAASLIEAAREKYTHLHIVINAAGVSKPVPFLNIDEYDWRRILDVNLTGAFFMTQLAGRVMAAESGGVIVHLGSAFDPAQAAPEQAPYMASKAGLSGMVREAAHALAASGVRVNAVCPAAASADAEQAAAVMLFLCSQAARAINGQAIVLS